MNAVSRRRAFARALQGAIHEYDADALIGAADEKGHVVAPRPGTHALSPSHVGASYASRGGPNGEPAVLVHLAFRDVAIMFAVPPDAAEELARAILAFVAAERS